jgi:hypothetical protein
LSEEKNVTESQYKIRLYFSELENMKKGERVFDVLVQGTKVLENFDIVSEAGSNDTEVIKTFEDIPAGNTLTIKMDPKTGNTILSGIELIQETIQDKKISAK